MPSAWGKVASSTTTASDGFRDMAAAILAGNELLFKTVLAHTKISNAASHTAGFWGKISGLAEATSRNVRNITTDLLRLTTTTGTGLLGLGGLAFGIDKLAESVFYGTRAARGLGTTYGELKAFGTVFSPLGDADALLSNISHAGTDVRSQSPLRYLGATQQMLNQGDPVAIATAILPQLWRIAQQTPLPVLQQVMEARGIDKIVPLEFMRTLRATGLGDLANMIRQQSTAASTLALPPKVQQEWSEFYVKLKLAGQQIEVSLIEMLAPLAPNLGRLSDSLVNLFRNMSKSNVVGHWIDELGQGIDWLAVKLKDPDFIKSVDQFIANVGKLGAAIVNAVNWIADKLPDTGSVSDVAIGAGVGLATGGPIGALIGAGVGWAFGGKIDKWADKPDSFPHVGGLPDMSSSFEGFHKWAQANLPTILGGTPNTIEDRRQFVIQTMEKKFGWPAEMAEGLTANLELESGIDPARQQAGGPGYAVAQWGPERQAEFGKVMQEDIHGSSLYDQLKFINYELTQGHYKALGDYLRAHHLSAAEVAAYLSRYHEAPRDQTGEIIRRARLAQKMSLYDQQHMSRNQSRAQITVNNNTGGSATMSTAGLAATPW